MKYFKLSELPKSLWKNGQGTTTELAIFPANAQLSKGDFLWRISCAEILSSNQFSSFPGYDRLLVVWKGDGLILNNRTLSPFCVLKFPGEDRVQCNLVGGPVADLGIIYRRDQITVDMRVLSIHKNETESKSVFQNQINFIFCAQGTLLGKDFTLQAGEALRIEGPRTIEFLKDPSAKVIAIEIQK